MLKIQKKDGSIEAFSSQKIVSAIRKSANRAMYDLSDEQCRRVVDLTLAHLAEHGGDVAPVANVHNAVSGRCSSRCGQVLSRLSQLQAGFCPYAR